jgi:hypothetical protein
MAINTAKNPFGSYLEEALNVYVKSAASFALLFEWIFYISAKKKLLMQIVVNLT